MKNFSRSLVWLTISEIIFNAAGYVIHSALGRILEPDDYGRYSLVITLTTMIVILIGNGIPTAMSKYLSEIIESDPEQIRPIKRKSMKMQALLMASVTVVFFILAPVIAYLLGDSSLTPLFQLSALIIPAFAAASFYFYFYTGLHFFRLQSILKTVRATSRVIFIIGLAYFFGVKGAISGYIVAPLFVFSVAIICDIIITHRYFPAIKDHPMSTAKTFSAKTILNYAWPLTLFLLFYELISTIDLYFVKSLLHSDHLTGIYNAALTAGRIPYFLFYALTIILLPAISKTTAERKETETSSLINKSLRLMLFVLFPLVTLLALYSRQTILLIYGKDYLEAVYPMSLYVIGAGFLTVFYVLSFVLNGAGLVKIPMWLTLWGLILNVTLNFILIPQFELIGASFSVVVTSLFLMIGSLIYIKKHFAVHMPIMLWIMSIIAAILMIFFSIFLPAGTFTFIISSIILCVIYFGTLRISGQLTDHDIALFLKRKKRM
ncbi:MAG: flippase [Parcubacteria group bacterium]|jgi:O-antigen/teichoic acid export membrane protein